MERSQVTSALLLGRIRIECNGVRVDTRLSASCGVLLARLLLAPNEPLRRDEAAFALWPDMAEAEARAALRRTLYNLQRTLPESRDPWISCDSRVIAWASPDTTWVDAAEFERNCGPAGDIENAARLYLGEFAPTLDHQWIERIRARLSSKAVTTFETLIDRSASAGDDRGELHFCSLLLALDPWREDIYRRSMVARFRLGDRAGALTMFRTLCIRLKLEFGVEPMPETIECHARIAAGMPARNDLLRA